MIAIIDYGVGNLFSLVSSFRAVGADCTVTSDPETIKKAEKIVLPGVGAFADARGKLRASGLDTLICEQARAGKPLLGICLGMQMLFERSYEYGEHEGLGLLDGCVVGMDGKLPAELKIPHIGWNSLNIKKRHQILKYVNEGDYVYFVHSYFAVDCEDSLLATSKYGMPLTAAVGYDNVVGMQFHPEKSGDVGLRILRAFSEWEVN